MGLKAPDFASSDNPAADAASWLTRTLTFLYLPAFNFYLLLFPRWLSFDWSMNAIPLIQSFADVRNVATFVFYVTLAALLRACWLCMQSGLPAVEWTAASSSRSCLTCNVSQPARHHKPRLHASRSTNNNSVCTCKELQLAHVTSLACDADETSSTSSSSMLSTSSTSSNNSTTRAYRLQCQKLEQVAFATALLILPFLPATNLFFYVGFVVAERILYIPRYVTARNLRVTRLIVYSVYRSMGFCLFVAIGTEALMKRKTSKFITLIALSILLMSFAARTYVRNIDWHDEENLYRAGIAINPPKGELPLRLRSPAL